MTSKTHHSFHIPVMGLAYTVDTPVKVARFGISSVISIIEDHLVEQMREFYCKLMNLEYVPIPVSDIDHRALRITAYLNLINDIVQKQMKDIKKQEFSIGNDIIKYFEMLPEGSLIKDMYRELPELIGEDRITLENYLKSEMVAGSIDVNIMTKLDKPNYGLEHEPLPVEYCDAMSALRGFANSNLSSSVIFSAGLNPRLYSYCETFSDFLPDKKEHLKKKIILKVSDYRSALIQGKFLAKKGLWISEFRIESGLNCGGHAFATEGLLLGPILEEFKEKKNELRVELFNLCNATLASKGKKIFTRIPEMKITVQGGIGTHLEDRFLLEYYNLNGTGWGSPFLLVPEVTNVDDHTLNELAHAKKEDYYLSHASPLGIPFNNFRRSSSETQRKMRIEKGRPGSPCYKKFLSSNTEFTPEPICTASREYQNLKIKQLRTQAKENTTIEDTLVSERLLVKQLIDVMEKDCLCEGLAVPALIKNNLPLPHNLSAVTICPGPNLAYFSGTFSLHEMTDHIYGRKNILNTVPRPHMFINELVLYIDYLKKEFAGKTNQLSSREITYFQNFRENLYNGIEYYKAIVKEMKYETSKAIKQFRQSLDNYKREISLIPLPSVKISL